MATMTEPFGAVSATLSAAAMDPPAEMPTKMPSERASERDVAIASASVTGTIESMTARPRCRTPGMKSGVQLQQQQQQAR